MTASSGVAPVGAGSGGQKANCHRASLRRAHGCGERAGKQTPIVGVWPVPAAPRLRGDARLTMAVMLRARRQTTSAGTDSRPPRDDSGPVSLVDPTLQGDIVTPGGRERRSGNQASCGAEGGGDACWDGEEPRNAKRARR
jgi:hypothetical protein